MSLSKLVAVLWLGHCVSLQASTDYKFKHFKASDDLRTISHRSIPIFDKLEDLIKTQGYKAINSAIKAILKYRGETRLGEHHFPTLDWGAGVSSNVEVAFRRKLEPRLDGEGWIVMDQVILGIGAQAYLRYLKDQGEIQIGEEQLKLFAGIFFKKEYTYQHHAASYKEGLTQNIDKLLGSYKVFRGVNFLAIEEGEVVSQQDFISADIGMSVKTPSIYWLSLKGAATIYFSSLNSLRYLKQSNSRASLGDFNFSYQKEKVKGSQVQLELQLDFLNLLKMTLFGGEYRYDITKDRTSSYLFTEAQSHSIPHNAVLLEGFKNLNNGEDPEKIVEFNLYKLSSENSLRVGESSTLYNFMWGKFWGNMTEEIIFSRQSSSRFLYRHQQERVAFNRSLLKIFTSPSRLSSHRTREVENLIFEYESPEKIETTENVKLPEASAISFRLSKEFSSKRSSNSDRKKVLSLIKSFQSIDGGIIQGLEQGVFQPPYYLDIHAQVAKAGILESFNRTPQELRIAFGYICTGAHIRPGQKLSKKVVTCMRKFSDAFRIVLTEYHLQNKFSLFHLKLFLGRLSQISSSFRPMKLLFGADNVQLYGHFTAKKFATFHKEGHFQGHGVIKDILLSP